MARQMYCPKCDADISDTYEGADPECGILVGGWFCDACNEGVLDHEVDDEIPVHPNCRCTFYEK